MAPCDDKRPYERAVLGRTGLEVCRLGVAPSYGVPASAVERAYEHGVNYLYWGSRRTREFGQAIRNLAPRRDRFVLVLQSYSRVAALIAWSVERALRELHLDHADILLLGLWNHRAPERIVDACRRVKRTGLVRFLAVSTHNRPLIPQLANDPAFDVFHLRYNAVHTGAERDVFPHLPAANPPGIVSFTATNWRQLLGHRRMPRGEKIPTASDCYRFVLANPAVDVCLSGPSDGQQMDHAIEALRRGPMPEDELAWMRRVGDAIYGKPRR